MSSAPVAAIGFTGTRYGMTVAQRRTLRLFLANGAGREFHHGDCVGADAEAHDIAVAFGFEPVIHPPVIDILRAFKDSRRILAPRKYRTRNRDIVRNTSLLIAAPAGAVEKVRSGTWWTVRFARKLGCAIVIIFPDGSIRVAETAFALSGPTSEAHRSAVLQK